MFYLKEQYHPGSGKGNFGAVVAASFGVSFGKSMQLCHKPCITFTPAAMNAKLLLLSLMVLYLPAFSQKKADRALLEDLAKHAGQMAAAQQGEASPGQGVSAYIAAQFKAEGLQAGTSDSFLLPFAIDEGRAFDASVLQVNQTNLQPGTDFFPLPYSAEKEARGEPLISVQEPGNIWIVSISDLVQPAKDASADGLQEQLYQAGRKAVQDKASGIIFYDTLADRLVPAPDQQTPRTALTIPVVYVKKAVAARLFHDETASADISMQVKFSERKTTLYNVAGYIDNKAASTVVLGACYPCPAKAESIDASRTGSAATLIELGKMLKESRYHRHNYLLVAFPERDTTKQQWTSLLAASHIDTSRIGYIVHIGQLSGQDNALQVAGINSAAEWKEALSKAKGRDIKLGDDPSATPGAAFYPDNVPALFLHGTAAPGANAGKDSEEDALSATRLVYDLIGNLEKAGKLAYTGSY